MYDTNFAAVEQSQAEISKMSDLTYNLFPSLEAALNDPEKETKKVKEIFEKEKLIDTVQHELTEFITDILANTASLEFTEQGKQQLRICDELESVSDYIERILKLRLRLLENNESFSESQNGTNLILTLYGV